MAIDLTSPLDISLAPVAFGLDALANLLVFVLGCSEWSQPWGYTRSDYNPEEFCQYILRWILDGNDKIIACLALFSLPFVAKRFIPSVYSRTADLQSALDTRNQECRQAKHKNRDLESQNSSLEEQIRINATASAETITTLQGQNDDLKMKLSAEQEAKQRESEKASSAAAEMDAQMKRLSQETERLRQRAEKAEKALHEKGNAMKTAEQKRQQLESRIESAAERIEKLEEEAEEHKSEQAALQERAETAESNQHTFKAELKSSESQRQTLQDKLDITRNELSQITRKSNKAADDVSTLQKELRTTNQVINSKEAECKALKDAINATTYRCTELEKEEEAFNAAKKQQQHEANSKLDKKLEQAERKLNESTERENRLNRKHDSDKSRLQEQLKIANSEVQKLSEESRVAGLENTKLAERCGKAEDAVEQAKKLQQECQSKTQEVQETLKNCRQALKQKTEAKDKQSIDHNLALEAKEKELKEAVRSNKANIEKLEISKVEATEKTADHDKNMAHAQAELKTLQHEMDLKSSTIESLELELELASVEVAEAKDIVQLLESKKWHEYARMQEAWILESYTIIQDKLEQAESHIQALEVSLEGLAEEHEVALEEKDKAFANQMRQYEGVAGQTDEHLEACDDHEANRTPKESMERENELGHGIEPTKIAAPDDDLAVESEFEDLEGEGTVHEDEKNDTSSQHGYGFEEKYRKAVADAIPLRKELAAAVREIQAQTNNYQTLSGLENAAKERCANLERHNEALQASSKQQQEANLKLDAEHKAQLNRNTQHANKLQREVDGLHAEMHNKDNELRNARIEHAKLMEQSKKYAETAAAEAEKRLQKEKSKNQIQQTQAEPQTQDLKTELLVCQRKLELMTQNHDCLKEDTDAERDQSVREYSDLVQKTKDIVEGFEEEFKQQCKGLEDLRASLATAESLDTGVLADEDGDIDDSSLARQQSTKRSKRAGKDIQQRKRAVQLQLERNAAVEALSHQTHGQHNQQHQAPRPAQFIPQQQAPPQFFSEQRTEFIPPQQYPAHSLQPNQLVGTLNSSNPAPVAFQPPPQQIHTLRGSQHRALDQLPQPLQRVFQGLSASQHGPGNLLRPPQQQTQGLGDSRWA